MQLKVTQENLSKALSIVSRTASSRGTLPILSNVLIRAGKNSITLSATNLELAITTTLKGRVEKEGSITVPAKLMSDFVSGLPKETIDLYQEGSSLIIQASKYKSTVNGTQPDEFPSLPEVSSEANKDKIDSTEFKHTMQKVVFSASSDEARQVLTGVNVRNIDGSIVVAATDSYRLAEGYIGQSSTDYGLIIPAATIQEVLRVVGGAEDDLFMSFDESQVQFNYDNVQIVSRLIDGNYPDYRQLIPADSDTAFTVKKEDFINIAKVSSLFARESAGSITLHVSEESQEVSIVSIASQVGENTSRAGAKVTGSGDVTLNSRYLLDALGAFDSDEISFRFSGKINPCVISGNNPKDKNYTHIIMPLRS